MKTMIKKLKGNIYKLFTLVSISSFTNEMGTFRLKSYMYVYEPSDYKLCKERKSILVPKILANAVHGCGICGNICKFSDLHKISFNIKRVSYREFDNHKWTIQQLKDAWKQYKFLRSVPKELTWDEYKDYSLASIMKSINKS